MRRAAFHGCLLDINVRYVTFPSSRLFSPCAVAHSWAGALALRRLRDGRRRALAKRIFADSMLALLHRPRHLPRCRFQPPRRWRVCLCSVGHSARPPLRSVATSRRTRGRSRRNFAPHQVTGLHVSRHRLARDVPPRSRGRDTLRDRRAESPSLRYSLSYAIRHRTAPHATTTRPSCRRDETVGQLRHVIASVRDDTRDAARQTRLIRRPLQDKPPCCRVFPLRRRIHFFPVSCHAACIRTRRASPTLNHLEISNPSGYCSCRVTTPRHRETFSLRHDRHLSQGER